MEENMIVIRDPKPFYFGFDWPKDVDGNLKCKISIQIILRNSLPSKYAKLSEAFILLQAKVFLRIVNMPSVVKLLSCCRRRFF